MLTKCVHFLGFGVDEIDSFSIKNCGLPSIPFYLIFHRTSISNSKERNNKRQVTGSNRISVVRSLKLESYKVSTISVRQLNSLFFGLDSLEFLKLKNFELKLKDDDKRISKRSVTTSWVNHTVNPISYSIAEKLTTETTTTARQRTTIETTTVSVEDELRKNIRFTKLERNDVNSVALNASSDREKPLFSADNSTKVTNRAHHFRSNSVNNTKIADIVSTEASIPNSVRYKKLNFTFGQLFPKLKRLILESFMTNDAPENPYMLKELLTDLKFLEEIDLLSNVVHILPTNFLENSSSLKTVYLRDNKISKIETNALFNLKMLEILDLSRNLITNIAGNTFKDLVNLKNINLSRNQLKTLNESLFAFTSELNAINLDQNNLTYIPSALFTGLNSLKSISLNDCNLQKLTNNADTLFSSAPNVEIIGLKNNRLRNLTAVNLFARNVKLSKLDISYNEIEVISPEIFSTNSSSLVEFNLYGNELKSVNTEVFFYLKNLKKLNLAFNNLTEVSPKLFYNLVSLEEINLAKNELNSINSERSSTPFGAGKSLKVINLSANNLTQFEEFNVINWSVYLLLEKIDLSKNRIAGEVEIPVFHSVASELVLNLSFNNITSVNVHPLQAYENEAISADKDEKFDGNAKLNQLIVKLDSNPLQCDCHLYSFLKYAKTLSETKTKGVLKRASFELNSRDLFCATPDQFANKSLTEISLFELTCRVNEQVFCPQDCNCLYRPDAKMAEINCENKGLKTIPFKALKSGNYEKVRLSSTSPAIKFENVDLNLRFNNITSLEPLHHFMMSNLSDARKKRISVSLYLDHNRISELPNHFPVQTKSNASHISLKVLSLKHNLLKMVPHSFLSDFKAYINASDLSDMKLYLGGNPFDCETESNPQECEMRHFKLWLVSNHLVVDNYDVSCESLSFNSSSALIHIPDNILCPHLFKESKTLVLCLAVTVGVLAVCLFIVTCLYYRNKQTILAFVYIHLHPVFVCFNFSEEDIDEDKLYDAFVSYSSADRDIVMQLIEKLEKPSKVVTNTITYLQSQVNLPSIHEGISDQIVPEVNRDLLGKPQVSKPPTEGQDETSQQEYFKLCVHERDWLPGNLISWNIVNSVQNSRRTILVLSKEFIKSIWFQVEFHTAYYQMLEDKMDRLIVIVKGELPAKEEMDKDLVFLLTTKTYLVWGEKWFWEKLRYALPHKKRRPAKLTSDENRQQTTFTVANKSKSPSKNEIMKEYVEQTIANHFQLNAGESLRNNKNKSNLNNVGSKDSKIGGVINESFVIETET
ncbi:Toll-like protein [Leptotrombidium deliense]|uniref:Toll-like protein n=1 Tax=Leptotrombidium deliense TaxID=299467 RepID=A0A443SVW6_9ACAR|nr:Toll-like protein [Leptotrombidium deliense]